MKKYAYLALIWGWFFAMSADYPEFPGVKMISRVGFFKTEKECDLELASMKDFAKEANLGVEFSAKCIYKQEV